MDELKKVERYVNLVLDAIELIKDEKLTNRMIEEVENVIHLMRTKLNYPI